MGNNVRKLTDGALMLAIVGLFVLLDLQMAGMLTGYMPFLIPLPFSLFGAKYGLKNGLMVWSAGVLMTFILGGFTSFFYVFCYGFCGLYYGNGVKTHQEMAKVIIVTCLIAIFVNAIVTVIFANFFGYDLIGEIATLNALLERMDFADISGVTDITAIIKTILIISTIMLGICEGIIIHFSSLLLLTRLKYKVARPNFKFLEASRISGYLAFGGYIAYPLLFNFLNEAWMIDGLFILSMLCALFLMFYGTIITNVALKKYFAIKNPLLRGIIIIIALLIFNMLIAIVGFMYLTTDLKERINTDATNR
ncbi:MAG: YybS family protein [Erysipelotrichaceae bacterium]|nr:YybS family protein [Erysipelotrichaceae bacterium]MDY5251889.1 DUF2232 domain-containing protein [Erysipelotrichaceae bacterium]